MLLSIIQNVTILLSFCLLYDMVWSRESRYTNSVFKVSLGLIIGLISIVLMKTAWVMMSGLVFDTRSILLLNAGLFFGPVPTLVAVIVTSVFRIIVGGSGVYMGIAVSVSSGAIGILWKKYHPQWRKGNYIKDLFMLGYLTHIVMLFCTVFLPKDLILPTFKKMFLPLMLIYPLGVVLFGRILILRMSGWKMKIDLKLIGDRYEKFINSNKDAMFVKDENLKYVIVNDKMCQLFNKKREELLDKSQEELLSKSEIDSANDLIMSSLSSDMRVLNGEAIFTIEQKVGERFYEVTKFPVSLPKGKLGVGGIMADVTDKRKKNDVQQVLLDISRIPIENTDLKNYLGMVHYYMRRVIKSDNIYIALYHKDENKYSFPYYLDETEKLSSEELFVMDKSLTDYIRVTGKGRLVTSEVEAEIVKEFPLEVYGEESPVWMGAPLMGSLLKEVIGVIAVQDYHDSKAYNNDDLMVLEIVANYIGSYIERVNYLNRLKAAKEKAEESDRLKSAFLANISHEIRTPLNGIIGFTDVLKEDITDVKQIEYITIIRESAYKLLYTVNDVIDIAKIEAGELSLHKETFCVDEVLDHLFSFFNSSKLPFKFTLETPTAGKYMINTDKTKLSQIFTNLLSNAFKFTTEGFVKFGYWVDNNQVIFYVRDSGIGISKENQAKVFNRFYQVENGMQKGYEGTGLGLSIVKEYINSLDGEIWVDSEPGVGTVFYFTIASGL